MNIEQIALEVANEMPMDPDFATVKSDVIHEFLHRCLAKIGEGLEPVASVVLADVSGDENNLMWASKFHAIDDSLAGKELYATPHEDIIAAEQRVAEACRKLAEERSCKAADSWDRGFNSASDDIANAIRSGEWRKYYEQEAKN